MELKYPSIKYKNSFIDAFEQHKDYDFCEEEINLIKTDFELYIKTLADFEKSLNLPERWVPFTTLWAIKNEEYIGRVSIRHYLRHQPDDWMGHIGFYIIPPKRNKGYGKKVLDKTIVIAKELYKQEVLETYKNGFLITCDKTNIASQRIIEANDGVFEKEHLCPQLGENIILRRYLINAK